MRVVLKLVLVGALTLGVTTAQVFTPPQVRRPAKGADLKEFTVGVDEPGCKDSPLLPRMQGCSILQCDVKEDDSVEIATRSEPDGTVSKEPLDGATEVIYYLCPTRVTHAGIIEFAEAGLAAAGHKVSAKGKDSEDYPLLAVTKDDQWIQISTYQYESKSAYILTAVKVAPEEPVTAEAVEAELAKSGRIALQGLRFDKDKADLPPGGEKLLGDIALILAKKADWKIRVEARGDGPSNDPQSLALSEKRATVVASWLTERGVDKSRLLADGSRSGSDEPCRTCFIDLVKY